jgi:hypothetical protein
VTISGFITNPPHVLAGDPPMKYRVSVRPYEPSKTDAENPWQPLRNEFQITVTEKQGSGPPTQYRMDQAPDADGFYTYREDHPPQGWRFVAGRVLARWQTGGREGRWEVRLETKRQNDPPVPASTIECADGTMRSTVVVRLDNTQPDAAIDVDTVEHPDGSTEPASECGKFTVGDTIHGSYSASDEHFRRLSFGVQPGSHAKGATIDPSSRSYPTVPTSGESGTWTLDTSGMDPCGYIARLHVHDRTIVNSGHVGWNAGSSAGFCLEAEPESDGGIQPAAPTQPMDIVDDDTAYAPVSSAQPSVAIVDHQFDTPGDDHEHLDEEYVTFENVGENEVELTGWRIADDAGNEYVFPEGFTLKSQATVTVYTGSGEDTDDALYWGAEQAIWDNTGDSVFLYDDDGELVAKESY